MRTIVVLSIIAFWFAYSIFSTFGALVLYWWLAIFRPQDWVWEDITFLPLSLASAGLLLISSLFSRNFPRLNGFIPVSIVFLVGLEFVAYTINGCGTIGSVWLEHLAKLALVLLLTERIVDTSPRRWLGVVGVVGLSLGFFAGKAGLNAILAGGSSQYGIDNLGGSFSGSNGFALGTAAIVFYLLLLAPNTKMFLTNFQRDPAAPRKYKRSETKVPFMQSNFVQKWGTRGLYAAALFSTYNIFSLQSRGSSVAVILAIIFYVALQPRGPRLLAKLIPVVFIGLLVVPLPEGFTERLTGVVATSEERDNSAESRPHFWKTAYRIAVDHPLGIGPKCYSRYYDRYDETQGRYGTGRSVHGSHAQILSEIGFPGTILWFALILFSCMKCRSVMKQARAVNGEMHKFFWYGACGILCSTVAFTLGGTFYEAAHMELIWLNFILAHSLHRILVEYQAKATAKVAASEPVQDANLARMS